MKHDRLFQILYILIDKKIITAPKLAEKLEVSVRTIYRDIDTLSACGVPIYAMPGKNGGISLMPEYKFDGSILTDNEQSEMLFALESLKATNQNLDVILSKLGAVFKKPGSDWIEVDFSRWGHKEIDINKFNNLRQSIINKIIIHITYLGSSGDKSSRDVKPIKLIFKHLDWYLQGFCMKTLDFRIFKINRILSINFKDKYIDIFENIPAIDSAELSVENYITVEFKISQDMAFRVYDEFTHKNIKNLDDNSLMVTAILPYNSWIYSYILSFGDSIEILQPKYLKSDIVNYLKKLSAHFKT